MAGIPNDENQSSPAVAYLQAYFVTIATILGTGILGLPVMLTGSGLYPFLISFLIDACMQSVLIHFFVDLLQRTYAVQLESQKEESVPLNEMVEEEINVDYEDGTPIMKEVHMPAIQGHVVQPPNLHLMGQLFLGCGMHQAFDILIILQFVALLICYALAGSEAYAQLIGVDHFYVIPFFVWILTFGIVFALRLIQPIVSVLTFIKGSVLLATTLVTFYVGVSLGRTISNDFSFIGAPFLMGTVALGGTINTMPFTFEKIRYNKAQISNYRWAVHLGLWTCVILNILWCWAVLDIVPQTVEEACINHHTLSTPFLSNMTTVSTTTPRVCYGELSLESAKINGEISTLPLTKILQRDYPSYTWVAILVEVFIMVSITVSYLTIGGALHHTLTGVVTTISRKRGLERKIAKESTRCDRFTILSTAVSLLAFIIVFAVAMMDPQGFVDILEKFASFTMNGQAGFFVFLMLLAARKSHTLDIPLPIPSWAYYLQWTIPIFFGTAVVVDVVNTVRDILHPEKVVPVVYNSTDVLQNLTTVHTVLQNLTTPPALQHRNVGFGWREMSGK